MRKIFISYRRADTGHWVERLARALELEFGGHNIFLDVVGIQAGMDFRQKLETELKAAFAVLVMIGPEFMKLTDKQGNLRIQQENDYVRYEIQTAIELDKFIIPILTNNATMPASEELPDSIATLSYIQSLKLNTSSDFNDIIFSLKERKVSQKIFPRFSSSSAAYEEQKNKAKNAIILQLSEWGWSLESHKENIVLVHKRFPDFRFFFYQNGISVALEFLVSGAFGRSNWQFLKTFTFSPHLSAHDNLINLPESLKQAGLDPKAYMRLNNLHPVKKKIFDATPNPPMEIERLYKILSKGMVADQATEQKRQKAHAIRHAKLSGSIRKKLEISFDCESIFTLLFHPGEEILLAGTENSEILLWNFKTGQLDGKLTGHKESVRSLFLTDSGLVLSGAHDGTIRLWDMCTRSEVYKWTRPYGLRSYFDNMASAVNTVTYSSNGEKVAAAFLNGEIVVWGGSKGKVIWKKKFKEHFPVTNSMSFTPDGQRLVICGSYDSVRLLNANNGEFFQVKKFDDSKQFAYRSEELQLKPKSNEVVLAQNKGLIQSFNLSSLRKIKEFIGHDPKFKIDTVISSISFSANGKYLSSLGSDERLIIWDYESAKPVAIENWGSNPFIGIGDKGHCWYSKENLIFVPLKQGRINIYEFIPI